MSITFLGSWKNETTASPLNITISPALAADDFIVAVAATDGGGDTMGGSAPLSTIDVRTSTADAQTSYTAAGKVTGALSLVTLTAAPNACIGGVVAFSGVHKTDPFDAATVSGGSSAAGTVFQLTITTVTPNTMLVFPIGFDTQSTTSPTVVPSDNVSGGLTWGYMPIDTASFQHAGIAYANMPVPGTVTVTLTITNAINAGWGGSLLALKSDGPVATAEQKSFRFRNDDGSETSATWKANLNTPIALAAGTTARLRFLIATVLDRASVGYQLEYKRDTDSLWNAVVAAGTPTLSYGAAGTIGYSAASGTTVAATYPAGITNKSALIMVVGDRKSVV